MADSKPLPALPYSSTPDFVRLTVQSLEHRNQFIRFVLSELGDPWIDSNLAECIQVLEDALDDLGTCIGSGQWLRGIKKQRLLQRKKARRTKSANGASQSKELDKTTYSTERASSSEADSLLTTERLRQFRDLVAKPDVPSPTIKPGHLLLCLAPYQSHMNLTEVTEEESGFDFLPSSFGCSFRNQVFELPSGDDISGILYGLHELDIQALETPRIVGGTFAFQGVPALQSHRALAKALKMSIFVHLSLLLEQQLLINSHVQLTIARPRVRVRNLSSGTGSFQPVVNASYNLNSSPNGVTNSHRHRSIIPNSILSFFSRHSLGRTPTHDALPLRSSLDSVPFPPAQETSRTRSSMDESSAAARLRKFSFLSPSPIQPANQQESHFSPFSAALARIESQKNVLSTSIGVVLDPPILLVRLADKEQAYAGKKVHLMADERVALDSLLGWGMVDTESGEQLNSDRANAKEVAESKGMTGICGFVNQQGISILVSSHVPLHITSTSPDVVPETNTSASASSSSLPPSRDVSSSSQISVLSESSSTTHKPSLSKSSPTHTSCEQAHWTLYRYYSNCDAQTETHNKETTPDSLGSSIEDNPCTAEDKDRCLGEVITSWIDEADTTCDRLRTVPLSSEARGGIGMGIMQGLGGSGATPTKKRCEVQVGKHERRFVHGGVRISAVTEWPAAEDLLAAASVVSNAKDQNGDDERVINVWESCSRCGAQTGKKEMSDGAYLSSFAKFLELLIYSPLLCKLEPRLCEHTDSPSTSSSSTSSGTGIPTKLALPPQRFNILRHFSTFPVISGISDTSGDRHVEYTVSFKLAPIEDIFELRVPRLQISPWAAGGSNKLTNSSTSICNTLDSGRGQQSEEESHIQKEEEAKKKLRREIKTWWEGVADHMDLLEEKFSGQDQVKKALPRLPSTDDAYDSFDDDDDISISHEHPTPKPKISGLPDSPTTPVAVIAPPDHSIEDQNAALDSPTPTATSSASLTPTPSNLRPVLKHASSSNSQLSSSSASSSTTSSMSLTDSGLRPEPMQLLSNLRQTFHRIEQTLYTQLARTPPSSLNEVRRAFLSASRGAERRLIAWQKKHLGSKKDKRKKDGEGLTELDPSARLRAAEPEWWNPACHVVPEGNIIIREDDWGSIIAFTLSTIDYRRELASMSVARSSSTTDLANTPTVSTSSFFSAAATTGYKLFRTSALVQPDPDQEDVIWHEAEAYSAVISRKEHPRDPTSLLSIREVLRQKSPDSSILSGSRFTSLSSSTSGKGGTEDRPSTFPNGVPPSAWAKPDVQLSKYEVEGEVISGLSNGTEDVHQMLHELDSLEANADSLQGWSTSNNSTIKQSSKAPSVIDNATIDAAAGANTQSPTLRAASPSTQTLSPPPASKLSLNSFTNGMTNAIRLVLPTQNPSQVESQRSTGPDRHHGLLTAAEVNAIDERPHVQYDWTIGKRLKFSCMVYYAKQFDNLRKRCGIESVFLESLSRSANWSAEGGKSKSNFWKTADDRFIIKTLVNAWNVADLQVLIDLGPSYFRYMESTTNRPTILAKLLGFYTIEIRNLETGNVQSKTDLLVMENLFFEQKIDKAFDLKGIQGRKVKAGTDSTAGHKSKTLFDGEWIEGQQQTLTLVRPHSKAVLREAIKSDADFLSKSNIMDYSLLLGVDIERKQIACGLVDTIGSYTFAKTLEYKAKQGLNSRNGKEVTVMPPAEYQLRFTNALERYFLACPDKWSRPLDAYGRKMVRKLDLLPSVL
ncbi:hypothetical protein C8R42DRAFT_6170 [Lentinula raphanica]|nr:hypothetical protein C8R42DRAFT_6170 [Lentinula raphanica]